MHWVYKNSFLNLVAAASLNATGGLFRERNPRAFTPCISEISDGNGVEYIASSHVPEDQSLSEDPFGGYALPIITRGWVLQELLLPSRTLILGKEQLHWYCREHHGTETFPDQEARHMDDQSLFKVRTDWRDILINNDGSWFMDLWFRLVHEYSSRKLTKFSDRLIAISGLASELGTLWDARYLAG
jgi:hypothetical protein